MCDKCDKKLGDVLGMTAETIRREEQQHNSDGLTADATLRASQHCADMLKGYSVLVSNVLEDVGTGLGVAVLVAVNGKFVQLADTTGVPQEVALMMAAMALKEVFPPLSKALTIATKSAQAPQMPQGDGSGN